MDTEEFLDALIREMPRCDAERVGAERYGAPRLSAFELLGTKENTLSDVIADLLDPRGTHGQGPLFLNALLRAIDEPVVHVRDGVRVTREFATRYKRRIDIVIETPTSLVGIENKPFAGQGTDQLSDYHADLVARAGDRRSCLVFLSDTDPETAQDVTRIVRFWDWGEDHPSLCGLLNDVRDDIRASPTHAFVDDFLGWIARHFGGETMTDELEPYTEEVLARFEQTEDRKAIGAVLLAGEKIRAEVIDRIGQHVWSALSETDPDLHGEDGELSGWIDEKYGTWRMWRSSWPPNCTLAIEAQQGGAKGVCYGVRALKPDSSDAASSPENVCDQRAMVDGAVDSVPGGSRSVWWPWYRTAPTPNWTQEFIARLLIEANGAIEDHPDVRRMTADLVELAGAIDAAN